MTKSNHITFLEALTRMNDAERQAKRLQRAYRWLLACNVMLAVSCMLLAFRLLEVSR